jgi:hypothetical protein
MALFFPFCFLLFAFAWFLFFGVYNEYRWKKFHIRSVPSNAAEGTSAACLAGNPPGQLCLQRSTMNDKSVNKPYTKEKFRIFLVLWFPPKDGPSKPELFAKKA